MRKLLSALTIASTIVVAAIALADTGVTRAAGQEVARGGTMRIHIDIEGTAMTATLTDSDTSNDFVSLLPLTLTLKDYAAAEKISDLPKKLSTRGAPAGIDPSIGDITYYSPWGNLAIFYRDADYASGLVRLGTIDAGVDTLKKRTGPLQVRITRVEQ